MVKKHGFLRVHNSYFVNKYHILKRLGHTLTLAGQQEIPISQNKLSTFHKEFMQDFNNE